MWVGGWVGGWAGGGWGLDKPRRRGLRQGRVCGTTVAWTFFLVSQLQCVQAPPLVCPTVGLQTQHPKPRRPDVCDFAWLQDMCMWARLRGAHPLATPSRPQADGSVVCVWPGCAECLPKPCGQAGSRKKRGWIWRFDVGVRAESNVVPHRSSRSRQRALMSGRRGAPGAAPALRCGVMSGSP